MSPGNTCTSSIWQLINSAIVRSRDQQDVHKTRARTGADDCLTDHRLISSIMERKIKLKRKDQIANNIMQKLDSWHLQNAKDVHNFQQKLSNEIPQRKTTWTKWRTLALHPVKTLLIQGKKKSNTTANYQRKTSFHSLAKSLTATKMRLYQQAKEEFQKTTRNLKYQWWREKKPLKFTNSQIPMTLVASSTLQKTYFSLLAQSQTLLKTKDGRTIIKTNTRKCQMGKALWRTTKPKRYYAQSFNASCLMIPT